MIIYIIIIAVLVILLAIHFMMIMNQKNANNKLKNEIIHQEQQQKQLVYETTVLKKIQESSSSLLDTEKVIDMVFQNIDSLITYSTISSLMISGNKMVLKTVVKEPVSREFVDKVKESIMESFLELNDSSIPLVIDEQLIGVLAADLYKYPLSSFFHIPLLVNDKVVAVITVASTKANCYSLDDMGLLYKVIDLASYSLSGLQMIMTIERGKLMAVIGSLADGLFMVDKNNQVAVINDTAKNDLHILKDNPTLQNILDALPATYDFKVKIQNSMDHNKTFVEKDVTLGEKVFQIEITPVQDITQTSTQAVIGVSVLLHDITLEKSVAKLKEDFTHIMVHELRSPLSSIKATSQLLTTAKSLKEEEKDRLLHLIYDQTKKMLDEVSLILDTAKLEQGLFTLQKMSGKLQPVIEEHASMFKSVAKEKMINLVIDLDPAIPAFNFDQPHVGQVINNLVSNSLKFTPMGGTITITAKPVDKKVMVSVTDTGSGIAKDKQHLLFNKFSQVASSSQHMGTGLGLYFVKGIVEAHGGTVSLTSDEGKGTTISFILPLDQSDIQPANPGIQSPAASTQSLNSSPNLNPNPAPVTNH